MANTVLSANHKFADQNALVSINALAFSGSGQGQIVTQPLGDGS